MSTKPRILIFIDWYLPAYKAGGPVRSIANLAELLKDKFDFYILTSDRDLGDKKPFEGIKTDTWISRDDINIFYASQLNKKMVLDILDNVQPQSIYFNSLFSNNFTLKPLKWIKKRKDSPKIILAPRGMLGKGALQFKKTKKQLFLAASKLIGLYNNIHWHATDNDEQNSIMKTFQPKAEKITLAPNIPLQISKNQAKIQKKSKMLRLVYYSRISPKKNIHFLTELLLKHFSDKNIVLEIWGTKEDTDYFNRIFESIEKRKRDALQIKYCGETKIEELQNAIEKNHFFVLPTLHENFGHVITEAMTCELPLIISDNTPWQNLEESEIGWDISLDDKKKWIETINHCYEMEDNEYQQLRQNVKKYYLGQVLSRNEELKTKYTKLFNE